MSCTHAARVPSTDARVARHERLALVEAERVPVVGIPATLRHRVEADRALARQPRMHTLLAVVRDALAPGDETPLDCGGLGDTLFLGASRTRSSSSVDGVLGRLGQREVRPRRHQGRSGEVVLEGLEPSEVGPDGHDAEIRLVPEDRERAAPGVDPPSANAAIASRSA